MLTNLVAVSWGLGLMGAARIGRLDQRDRGNLGDYFLLGGLAGAAPMLFLSPELSIDREALFAIGVTTGAGMWLGAFAPKIRL